MYWITLWCAGVSVFLVTRCRVLRVYFGEIFCACKYFPNCASWDVWCLLPYGVYVQAACLCLCLLPWLVSGLFFPTQKHEGVLYQLLCSKESKRTEKNMSKSKEAAEFMRLFKRVQILISEQGLSQCPCWNTWIIFSEIFFLSHWQLTQHNMHHLVSCMHVNIFTKMICTRQIAPKNTI